MFKLMELSKDGFPIRQNPYIYQLEFNEKNMEQIKYWQGVGLVPQQGFIALDIDDADEANKMFDLVINKLKLKCNVLQTTRGKHFWFKIKEPIKNNVKYKNAVGLTIDIRCGGVLCYLTWVKNGIIREWLTNYNSDELDYVPDFLIPNSRFNKIDFTGEGNRNNTIYKISQLLQTFPYEIKDKIFCLNYINENFKDGALDKKEMERFVGADSPIMKNKEYFITKEVELSNLSKLIPSLGDEPIRVIIEEFPYSNKIKIKEVIKHE